MADRRPLLYDPRVGLYGPEVEHLPSVRLIGLELRVRDSMGQVEELELLPIGWSLPCMGNGYSYGTVLPCTLHTSRGDINFEISLSPIGL